MMLQQQEPDDFVLATGEMHTVREFVEKSFKTVGVTISYARCCGSFISCQHSPRHILLSCSWEGEGDQEIGKDAATGKVRVRVDPRYYRPTEVELLLGEPTKAHKKLGWTKKVGFDQLVKEMVEADVEGVRTDRDN